MFVCFVARFDAFTHFWLLALMLLLPAQILPIDAGRQLAMINLGCVTPATGGAARARQQDEEPAATATAIACGEESERVGSEEMEEEVRKHGPVTNLGGPHSHGGVLFVRPRFQNESNN
jgi:hypothetical protein